MLEHNDGTNDYAVMLKHNLPSADAAMPGGGAWQSVLAEAVRSPSELCRRLGLSPALAEEAEQASGGFPVVVPGPYLARIAAGDPSDPLLLQVLPRMAETVAAPGYGTDPLGEAGALCGPNLLRKYQGRILMVTSGTCGVHCRYCFRRHFSYGEAPQEKMGTGTSQERHSAKINRPGSEPVPISSTWGAAVREIAADRSIEEVILSGGDPLSVPDEELARLAGQLGEIPHLRRLRVHSRLPVVIPQRVTEELISWIRGTRLSPMMVVQVNHPAEIDGPVAEAFGRLVDAGIPVLNQSVLLRGVNDRVEVLAELCRRLVDLRVMPYYLHQLDPVAGAAHFEVPISAGRALMAELRARLPGYAVPRYVREKAGGTSKEVLA
jgi:L-lysine 2,3-aminomutase